MRSSAMLPLYRFSRGKMGRGQMKAAEGQVLIIFALAVFVLIGMMALAVDAGFLMAERRQVQAGADAGAMAAAHAAMLTQPVGPAGQQYGGINADVSPGNVVVSDPDPGRGDKYVRVDITKSVDRFFLGAIYAGDWEVSAWAVAGFETVPADYGFLAKDEPRIHFNGNTNLTVDGGGVMSNTGISSSGGSNVVDTDGSIDAAGTSQCANVESGQWSAPNGCNESFPPFDDPLEGTSIPRPATTVTAAMMTAAGFTGGGSNWRCNSTCTLPSGTYVGFNITVQGTATLNGVYYFDGSTLSMQNTTSRIQSSSSGQDVLLYFTGTGAAFEPKNGEVHLVSRGAVDGGSDPVRHIVVYVDNCSDIDFQGNTNIYIKGIFYAPCSTFHWAGTPSGTAIEGPIIVGDANIKGNSALYVDYQKYVATTRPKVFLVD